MEKIHEDSEVEFEFTKSFFNLEKTCPEHLVGMKDLEFQRYVCPNCGKVLEKTLKTFASPTFSQSRPH